MMVEPASWFQTASDVAAWVGIPIAIGSTWYARKAVVLAEKKSAREAARVDLYLDHAIYIRLVDGCLCVAVVITITNASDLPNSLLKVELERPLELKGGGTVPVRLPLRTSAIEEDILADAETLRTPLPMGARDAYQRAAIFDIPDQMKTVSPIRDHVLVLTDGFGKEYTIEVNLIYGAV